MSEEINSVWIESRDEIRLCPIGKHRLVARFFFYLARLSRPDNFHEFHMMTHGYFAVAEQKLEFTVVDK